MTARATSAATPDDVRAWRQRIGKTQTEAAAALGGSLRQMQDYEAGRAPVPVTTALAMAAVEAGLQPVGTPPPK